MAVAMRTVISNLHNDAIGNIATLKQEQRSITNYVVLIYAALVGLVHLREVPDPPPWATHAMIWVVGLYGLYLVSQLQSGLVKFRGRLFVLVHHYCASAEIQALGLAVSPKGFWHDPAFLIALYAVISIGGGLAIWATWPA